MRSCCLLLLSCVVLSAVATAQPSFTNPQGGESIAPGSTYFINWTGTDVLADTIRLDYSTDGGTTWNLIVDKLTGTQLHQWNVPGTFAPTSRLRLIRRGPASTQTFLDLLNTNPNLRLQGAYAEFSKDGSKAVVTDDGGYVNLYNASTGAMLWSTKCGNLDPSIFISERAFAAKFNNDDSRLAVYTGTDSVIILDASNGTKLRSWHTNVLNWIGVAYDRDIEYSPDGSEVAVTCSLVVKVYDPLTGTEKRQFTNVFPISSMNFLRWNEPGKMLTCGTDALLGACAKLFDAQSGAILQTFSGAVGRYWGLDISPDNSRVLTANDDSTMRMWEVATGTEFWQAKGDSSRYTACDFNSDGSEFGAFGNGFNLRILSATSFQQARLVARDVGVTLDISPDNTKYLISNYQGGRIYFNQASQGIDTVYSGTFAIGTPTPDSVVNIQVGSAEGYPGDRVAIPVAITIGSSPLLDAITRVDFDLSFDATLLAPMGTTPQGTIAQGKRTLHFEVARPTGVHAMELSLDFIAALGDDSLTSLAVSNEQPVGYNAPLSKSDGMFHLLGVCTSGGPRYFNGDGVASMSVQREGMTARVDLRLIEEGHTSLVLRDALGREANVLLKASQLPGDYSYRLNTSLLAPGVYFLTAETPTMRLVEPVVVSR